MHEPRRKRSAAHGFRSIALQENEHTPPRPPRPRMMAGGRHAEGYEDFRGPGESGANRREPDGKRPHQHLRPRRSLHVRSEF